MIKRVLTFMFAVLLSVVEGKAEGIPSSYFSEVASGEFYLYNVTQQQFLNTEYRSLSDVPSSSSTTRVTTSSSSSSPAPVAPSCKKEERGINNC